MAEFYDGSNAHGDGSYYDGSNQVGSAAGETAVTLPAVTSAASGIVFGVVAGSGIRTDQASAYYMLDFTPVDTDIVGLPLVWQGSTITLATDGTFVIEPPLPNGTQVPRISRDVSTGLSYEDTVTVNNGIGATEVELQLVTTAATTVLVPRSAATTVTLQTVTTASTTKLVLEANTAVTLQEVTTASTTKLVIEAVTTITLQAVTTDGAADISTYPDVTHMGTYPGVSTATLGAHQAGDFFVAWAFRDNTSTAPAVPTAQGWSLVVSGGANSCAYAIATLTADSASEVAGTWTGATSLIIAHYRPGTNITLSIGATATALQSSSLQVSFPGLTLHDPSGKSWVIAALGHRSPDLAPLDDQPTGMVVREAVQDATDTAILYDTNGGVTSWSTVAKTFTGTLGAYRSYTMELRVNTPQAITGDTTVNLSGVTTAATTKLVLAAETAVELPAVVTTGTLSGSLVAANTEVTFGSFTSAATTKLVIKAQTTVVLGAVSTAGEGGWVLTANSGVALPAVQSAAVTKLVLQAATVITLPAITSFSLGLLPSGTTAFSFLQVMRRRRRR